MKTSSLALAFLFAMPAAGASAASLPNTAANVSSSVTLAASLVGSECGPRGCRAHYVRHRRFSHRRRENICDPIFAHQSSSRYLRSCTSFAPYTYDHDASPTDNVLGLTIFGSTYE